MNGLSEFFFFFSGLCRFGLILSHSCPNSTSAVISHKQQTLLPDIAFILQLQIGALLLAEVIPLHGGGTSFIIPDLGFNKSEVPLVFFLPSLLGSFTCSDVITAVGEEQLKPPEFIFISQHNVFSFICSIYVGGEVPSHWILN